MQQPMNPMGGPPGMPPRAQVVRRGTSKVVPVVVSAGLAVGVFCGLLFGVGTGGDEADAAPTTTASSKKSDVDDSVPAPFQPDPPKSPTATPAAGSGGAAAPATGGSAAGSGSATVAAAGSGSAAAPAAGSGSAAAPAAAGKVGRLIIKFQPEVAAKGAKVSVDGKPIDGLSVEVPLGDAKTKQVVVGATSPGYKDGEDKVEVVAGEDLEVIILMAKKPAAAQPTGGTPRPPTPRPPTPRPGNGSAKKPGGLIDI